MKVSLHWVPSFLAAAVMLVAVNSVAAPETAWQSIDCVPADPTPDALFDVVNPVDDFEGPTLGWTADQGGQQAKTTVSRDTSEHHGGRASLRVDYEFVGKKDYEYIQVGRTVEFAQAGQAFGFWLKHDGTAFPVRLRVTDRSGECHQFDMLCSAAAGWQFVACSLDGVSAAWGGDGNKRLDYPCKLESICIDRPRTGFVAKGCLWIDDAAVLRPAKPSSANFKVEIQDRRFGNQYGVGDTVSLRATGEGEKVRWSVVDFFGHQVKNGEGAATGVELSFPLAQPGWFSCKLELISAGRVVSKQSFPCVALPGGKESVRSDFFGACSHFGQSTYPLQAMELLRNYGIDQFRDEISWGSYEHEKGRLAMPAYGSNFLKHAAELKMRPLLIFDYANRNYDHGGYPNSPEAIEAFGRYAVDLARQTRGVVHMFEIWNEWVGGCGMDKAPGAHNGEAYGKLMGPTYKAVKQAFPNLKIAGIGGEYGNECAENILGAIRTGGTNMMDAWSIHPYRYPHSPELSDLVGEVNRIAGKVAGTGEKSKAWVTEIGYPTHRGNGGSDEAAQARYAVRTLVLLQSTRAVEKVFWYDLKDDGLTRDYNENNFGLIRHERYNCAPKPAIAAVSAFIHQTGAAEFRELQRPESLYVGACRQADGTDVSVVWSIHGTRAITVGGDHPAAYTLMGAAMPIPPSGVIEVTDNPIYVTGKNLVITAK